MCQARRSQRRTQTGDRRKLKLRQKGRSGQSHTHHGQCEQSQAQPLLRVEDPQVSEPPGPAQHAQAAREQKRYQPGSLPSQSGQPRWRDSISVTRKAATLRLDYSRCD